MNCCRVIGVRRPQATLQKRWREVERDKDETRKGVTKEVREGGRLGNVLPDHYATSEWHMGKWVRISLTKECDRRRNKGRKRGVVKQRIGEAQTQGEVVCVRGNER